MGGGMLYIADMQCVTDVLYLVFYIFLNMK